MILYIGNFVDDSIRAERHLSGGNPAASNRMARLAQALKAAGHPVTIISSATCLRSMTKIALWHPRVDREIAWGRVEFVGAVGIPYISSIWALIVVTHRTWILCRSQKIEAVIAYCYYPSVLAAAIAARTCGVTVIEDLEDISKARLREAFNLGPWHFINQAIGELSRLAIRFCVSAYIIPSPGFQRYLDQNERRLIITGSGAEEIEETRDEVYGLEPINILYAGKLEPEQGSEVFMGMLRLLGQTATANRYVFHVCGYGPAETEILKESKTSNCRLVHYGFVDSIRYKQILNSTAVALVLQNPNGIYQDRKTPSKAYEYLCAGKAVISTNLAEIAQIPGNCRIILENFSSESLLRALTQIDGNKIRSLGSSARKYALSNWSSLAVGLEISVLIEGPTALAV